jgi:hypothetical protein
MGSDQKRLTSLRGIDDFPIGGGLEGHGLLSQETEDYFRILAELERRFSTEQALRNRHGVPPASGRWQCIGCGYQCRNYLFALRWPERFQCFRRKPYRLWLPESNG